MTEENKEPETRRTVKKLGADKFELTVEVEGRSTTKQVYSKDEMRQFYDNAKHAVPVLQQNIKAIKDDIGKIDIEETDELKKLKEQLAQLQSLNQKMKFEADLKNQQNQLSTYERDIKEIELVMPEIKRRSKK